MAQYTIENLIEIKRMVDKGGIRYAYFAWMNLFSNPDEEFSSTVYIEDFAADFYTAYNEMFGLTY